MFRIFEMLGLRADTIDLKTTFFFLCDCIVLGWHIVFETFINLSVVCSVDYSKLLIGRINSEVFVLYY